MLLLRAKSRLRFPFLACHSERIFLCAGDAAERLKRFLLHDSNTGVLLGSKKGIEQHSRYQQHPFLGGNIACLSFNYFLNHIGILPCCILATVLHSFALAQPRDMTFHENSPRALRFSLHLPTPTFSTRELNGERYDVFELAGFVAQNSADQSALPQRSFTVILPPEGNPVLSFITSPGQSFFDKRLAPPLVPKLDAQADSLTYEFVSLPKNNSEQNAVRLTDVQWWRGFRLARLEVAPGLQIGNELQFFSQIEITLHYLAIRAQRAAAPLHELERKLLAPALNFQVGKYWRAYSSSATNARSDWELPNDAKALKLAVIADGLYKISYEDLFAAGWSVAALNPATLQLFHRGEEVPLYVRDDGDELFETGESLEFFGNRLAGDSSFYNDFTDENVYWLTGGRARGLRMAERQAQTAGSETTGLYFRELRHFEEDELYYHGDNDAQIYTTLAISGEGWIWKILFGGETFATDALLQNVAANAPPCSLRARLRGVTRDAINPNHRAQFFLNGDTLGEISFSNNDEALFSAVVPSNFLREGKNSFELRALNVAGVLYDQISLDWIEISYWRQYVASDNFLALREPAHLQSPRARYQITNLHGNDVTLFDRRNQQRLTGFALNQTAPEQFVLVFHDSAQAGRDYFVGAEASRKTPLRITRNAPSALRALQQPVDYVLITHANFKDAAQRLAEHRQRVNGLRVSVIEVEDIYDEFNFGMPQPEALRAFLRHAYENWRASYVCFFGDASWDPKKNAASSFKENFILSFGNPVSDNRLACFDGPQDFLPELILGRIPVETPSQAEAVVDKILAYEATPLADWQKNFLFINGGVDDYEQQLFRQQSEGLIARHITAPPLSAQPWRIYKTTPGRLIGELKPQIMSAIDNGALAVNFLGHAGSQTWDLMLLNSDIAEFANRDKYPFIASMTCHTVRFANPEQNSFGEEFLRAPEKGAAAFWGTTGWGFIFQDGVLLDSLCRAISRDSVRSLGAATTIARIRLWQALGASSLTVNTIDQYTLLGDPATTLALPLAPDLALTTADLQFTPSNPTEEEAQIRFDIKVRNLGLAATDSVSLSVRISSQESGEQIWLRRTMLPPLGLVDSMRVTWPSLGSRGGYLIRIEVDAENRIAEVDEFNNSAERALFFSSTNATVAAPGLSALLQQSQPTLYVYNPASAKAPPSFLQFELDREAEFNSADKITSPNLPPEKLRTKWQATNTLTDGLYFWRVRSIADNLPSAWQASWFWVDQNSPFAGARQLGAQLQHGVFEGTELLPFTNITEGGVRLAHDDARALQLQAQSAGHDDGNYCYLIVNFVLLNEDGRGMNLLALDPATQQSLAPPRVFDTFASQAAADSMAIFLENLPPRTILMIGAKDDASFRLTERAYLALENYGSALIRQVGLRDSWAMIGQKGLRSGDAVELHRRAGSGVAAVSDRLKPFFKVGSYHSREFGPAQRWHALHWQSASEEESAIALEISGRKAATQAWQPIRTGITAEQVDLRNIAVAEFPYLRLTAHMRDDDGLDSPALRGWSIGYDASNDLAVANHFFYSSADTAQEGDAVRLSAQMFNFTFNQLQPVSSAPVNIQFSHSDPAAPAGQRLIASSVHVFAPDEPNEVTTLWNTAGMRGAVTVSVEADPGNALPEPFEFNNSAVRAIFIRSDQTPPRLEVAFDGVTVLAGDYVSPRPEVICKIFDDSLLPLTDTSNVNVILNGARVPFAAGEFDLQLRGYASGDLRAEVSLRPQLTSGPHEIKFEIKDATGNPAEHTARVQVESELRLREVMNHPNPFSSETDFTYFLTQPAEEVRIKIFTVAGRLINTLVNAPAHAGFNQLHWNGRDAEGDAPANGVYLYKIIARSGAKSVEQIEKLVIMR